VYLGVEGEATRDQVTGLLWPEKDPDKARHALSQALYEIRRACGSECLESHGEWIRTSSHLTIDAAQFRALAEAGSHDQALELYGGTFLAGASLVQNADYEHWVERTQARLRRLHRLSRKAHLQDLLNEGDVSGALAIARRWVELEPLDDEAQHHFIQLLAASGRRSEAIHQFESFQRVLMDDDLEPLDETRELIDRIRGGESIGPIRSVPFGPEPDAGPPAGGDAGPDDDGGYQGLEDSVAGPRIEKPWVVELAETIKDWWVFRVTLAYLTLGFIGLQVADAFDMGARVSQRITALTMSGTVFLPFLIWALEPSLRRKMGYRDARPWRGTPRKLARGFWRFRGVLVAAAALLSVALGLTIWPEVGADPLPPPRTRLEDRIAVFPFEEIGSESGVTAGLAVGLTNTLINDLSTIEPLEVVPYAVVTGYGPSSQIPRDSVARALGAAFFVTGRLAQSGSEVSLYWDLTDTETLDLLATDEIRKPEGALFQLQDELQEDISFVLRQELGRELTERTRLREAANVPAWLAYYEGIDLVAEAYGLAEAREIGGAEALLDRAEERFESAADFDSGWPAPMLQLGNLAQDRVFVHLYAEEPLPPDSNEVLLRGGIRLANGLKARFGPLAEANELEGKLKLYQATFAATSLEEHEDLLSQAESLFLSALEIEPNRGSSLEKLAQIHERRGEYREARQYSRRADEADPFLENKNMNLNRLAHSTFELGGDEEAVQWCQEGRVRYPTEPMFLACKLEVLAFGDSLRPDPVTGWALVDSLRGLPGVAAEGFVPKAEAMVASILARAGLADSAQHVMGRVEEEDSLSLVPTWYYAAVWARLGKPDLAVKRFKEFATAEPTSVFPLARQRALDPLAGYPAFETLIPSGR
jgi:DNA-binding SARP family transcriptional activator/TolB-like protein